MMKKSKLFVAVLLTMVTSMSISHAQSTFYIGGAFPMSDFGDDSPSTFFMFDTDEETSAAATGLTLGLKFEKPLDAAGLSLFSSIDVMWNGLNGDIKDELEDLFDDYDKFELKSLNYINMPVMAGVKFEKGVADNMALFAEAGLGANFRFMTSLSIDYSGELYYSGYYFDYKATETWEFDPAVKFAYQVGAGIKINDSYTIGISYFNLGKAKAEGEAKTDITIEGEHSNETNDFEWSKLQTEILTIRLGFNF